MAQSKKKSPAKKASPANKLSFPKFNLNLSSIGSGLKQRFDRKPVFFTLLGSLLVFVLVLVGLFFYQRNLFVAGSVGGELITSPEFYSRLIKTSGNEVFDSLTQRILIKSEARKKDIKVQDDEIDKRLQEIEKSLGSKSAFENALKQNNLSLTDLREQLTIQLLVEKLLGDKIKVTEAEIDKYIAENKDTSASMTRTQVSDTIKNTKINSEFDKWYQDIKNKAKIYKFF